MGTRTPFSLGQKLALVLASTSIFSTTSHAFDIVDNRVMHVEAHGFTRVDTRATSGVTFDGDGLPMLAPPDGPGSEVGLGIARLQLKTRVFDRIGTHVQFEGKNLEANVLDAMFEFFATDHWSVRVGRFKTPVSWDFINVGAPKLRFVYRPALVRMLPRRSTGLELRHRTKVAGLKFDTRGGIFLDDDKGFWDMREEPIELSSKANATFATTVRLPWHVAVHAGMALPFHSPEHLMENADQKAVTSTWAPAIPDPVDDLPRFDAAVSYADAHLETDAEVVLAPHRDRLPSVGGMASAAYRVGDKDGLSVSPTVMVDSTIIDGAHTHRGSVGAVVALFDPSVRLWTDVAVTLEDGGRVTQAAFVSVQVGL